MSSALPAYDGYINEDPAMEDCELIQFRLTDSASRALEQLALTLGGDSFRLCINDDRQCFVIPLPEKQKFTFTISDLSNTSDSLLECLSSQNGNVRCLGKVKSRLTVNAKEDSFGIAKEKMAQLEEESRKQQTRKLDIRTNRSQKLSKRTLEDRLSRSDAISKPITQASRNIHTNTSSYSISPISTTSTPSPLGNRNIANRPLRDRVIHLLALRPYERPELLLRLARDGITQTQKGELDDVLSKVGKLRRGSVYYLSPSALSDLDPRWPAFSDAERNHVLSLKESVSLRRQSDSPGSGCSALSQPTPPIDESKTNEDDLGRRPTRASAPIAPHPISKKIAALDLLASGTKPEIVAERIGVSKELLDRWRSNEAALRERFARINGTNNDQHLSHGVPHNQQSHSDKSPSSPKSNIPNQVSQTNNPRISPAKRIRTDFMSTQHVTQMSSTKSLSPKDIPRTRAATQIEKPTPSNQPTTPPLSNPKDSLNQVLYGSPAHSLTNYNNTVACPIVRSSGVGGGTGSEGESASQTPCSNVSSVGSGDHANTAANLPSVSNRLQSRVRDRNSQPPLGSNYRSCDLDDVIDTIGTSVHEVDPMPATSIVNHSRDGYPIAELSLQPEQIDRLYPRIRSVEQAKMYYEEFQSTYPTYLQMYRSFPNIWREIKQVQSDLLDAAETEGLDSPRTNKLANDLEILLRRTRTSEYRNDLARLTFMAHKLRLLKQRLVESRNGSLSDERKDQMPRVRGRSRDSLKRKLTAHSTETGFADQCAPLCQKRPALV